MKKHSVFVGICAFLKKNYEMKEKQVKAVTKLITISTSFFRYARADYMEVLLT